MDQDSRIDYSVDYSFEMLDWMVTTGANKENLTVDEYIWHAKDAFLTLTNFALEEIARSQNKQFILEMIDEIIDVRCDWTLYDRFDFERKLPPSER